MQRWLILLVLVGCGPGSDRGSPAPAPAAGDDGGEAAGDEAGDEAGGDEIGDDADADPGPDPAEAAREGEGEGEPPEGPPPASPGCDAWPADGDLLPALHEALSDTYDPIDPEPDLGGELNRYTTARHLLFTQVERLNGGLECVYTGRFVETGPDEEPDNDDINCEHTWPRGRMADEDEAPTLYQHQQSDMHHLFPSDARTNSARGSLHFGEPVRALEREYAPAELGEDADGNRVFAPRPERRGDVARGLLYYSARWGVDIEEVEEAVLRSWADDDPPDDRERVRNDAIAAIQGNRNPFVDCPALLGQVSDFVAFERAPRDGQLPLP